MEQIKTQREEGMLLFPFWFVKSAYSVSKNASRRVEIWPLSPVE